MAKLHIIYIPGLGDTDVSLQQKALNTWRWWGVDHEIFLMNWNDSVAWQIKFSNLLDHIDKLKSQKKAVALVGVSAGASAVINAYAVRKDDVVGVVCIAGKINNPQDIGPRYHKRNPSFVESAYACQKSLETLSPDDKQHILSRYGLLDELVRPRDSKIPGAHNQNVPTIGHVITIGTQITLGAPSFIRFLKKRMNLHNLT